MNYMLSEANMPVELSTAQSKYYENDNQRHLLTGGGFP